MHSILLLGHNLTKFIPLFHRCMALLVLWLEVPLIRLILRRKLGNRLFKVVPRHSLIEPGGFNLFMSDIDLSLVVRSQEDIQVTLDSCRQLRETLPNLGEQEIYLPEEWKQFEELSQSPYDKIWKKIFQIRKIHWQRERSREELSDYDRVKLSRGMKKALAKLGATSDHIQAETTFPELPAYDGTPLDRKTYPYFDEYLVQLLQVSNDNNTPGLIFNSAQSADFLRSLMPTANLYLDRESEKIRIYLLRRELLMAKCQFRLLEWEKKNVTTILEWIQILEKKIAEVFWEKEMPTIEVVLHKNENKKEQLSLYFQLFDTPIARKYLAVLKESCDKQDPVYEPERTYNFPGDSRDNQWIADQLNKNIDIINAYSPVIHHRAAAIMDQDHMNHLHKYFEVYRGPIIDPPEFFKTAPQHVKKALEDYNVLIHRYEDYSRNLEYMSKGWRPTSKIVVTYAKDRHLLADEDFQHFSTRVVFGRYYLNYCEVGKPIWDMYQDNDEVVGEENILPLKYYSADAMIEFSPSISQEIDDDNNKKFYEWWDRNMGLMDGLGFKQRDPKNAVGHIPLADLDRNKGAIAGMDEEQIIRLIGQYPIIHQLRVHT